MAQRPPVHMKLHPENFDLLMTILAVHAGQTDYPAVANDAHDLLDKRLRFSRLRTASDGHEYVDIKMYENEAVETIWQLLLAAGQQDWDVEDYHSHLQDG